MKKILLVDDEPLVIVTLKSLINWESYGFEILMACSNGEEAYNYITHHKDEIDIILCDVDMPILNGIDLCEKLLANNIIINTIFLSSYSNFSYVRSAFHNGAYDYILKSELDENKLVKILTSLEISQKTDINKSNNNIIFKNRTNYFLSCIDNTNSSNITFHECNFDINYPFYLIFLKINHFKKIDNKKEIINIIEEETKNYLFNNYKHFALLIEKKDSIQNVINRIGSNLWNYINVSFDYQISTKITNEEQFKKEIKEIYNKAHSSSRLIYLSRKYIQENYKDSNLNLSKIAKEVNVSKNHLSRGFSKETNETIVEYISKIRIKEAQKLLSTSDLKTYEIAEEVGFSNSETFFRTFKKYCGITPKQYQKK
ncbi:MAG: response regulator transcription factor [Pleomorphochaeta sp.]